MGFSISFGEVFGLLCAFAWALYVMAIARIGPAKMATLGSVSPVFGLVMAVIFLKEKVTLRLVTGVGLCVVGVWLVL